MLLPAVFGLFVFIFKYVRVSTSPLSLISVSKKKTTKKREKKYGPFLCLRFNYPRAVEPLREENSLLTTSPWEFLVTTWSTSESSSGFEPRTPALGIQRHNLGYCPTDIWIEILDLLFSIITTQAQCTSSSSFIGNLSVTGASSMVA